MIHYLKNQKNIKKIDFAKSVIGKNIELFRCPICKQHISLKVKSLICSNNHCFDLAKSGYINLLGSNAHSRYDKQMLTARKIINRSGFFQKMVEKISSITLSEINNKNLSIVRIIDAGCGEGSNLSGTLRYLHSKSNLDFIGVGLDISKDGIYIASREYPGNIWCVADLAHSPFKDRQFDIIINILSPANYNEFSRLLKNDGLLIKVIPGHHYLREIRNAFYQPEEKHSYSNDVVIELFGKNFHILKKEHLLYQQKIKQQDITSLIKMTPLSWSIKSEDFQEEKYSKIQQVTVELEIIVGSYGKKG